MRIPLDGVARLLNTGAATWRDAEEPVRVAVFVDATASQAQIQAIREALVPQTTSALVRVARLDSATPTIKPDTDIAIVITGGSEYLSEAVSHLAVSGAPCAVVAESSVEVPFIQEDTRMLGLVCASTPQHMLSMLAEWICERTKKIISFAANFTFIRPAASMRVVKSCALTNATTGALVFLPGADFPVMTIAELGMLLELSAIHGRPLALGRLYEALGVIAAAWGCKWIGQKASQKAGYAGFIVKAAVGGAGTYLVGQLLCALYERDINYQPLDDALSTLASALKKTASAPDAAH